MSQKAHDPPVLDCVLFIIYKIKNEKNFCFLFGSDWLHARNDGRGKNQTTWKVAVDGPIVYGMVQSQSGISDWYFMLDFNDYGHITGTFRCTSDNEDSNIPTRLGSLIQDEINNYSSQ